MPRQQQMDMADVLKNLDEQYAGKDDILGKGILTFANRISSARANMFSSETDQAVPLQNPQFPRVFTNYENPVGEYSTAYKRAESNYRVIAKIPKFGQLGFLNHLYLLVLYDEDRDFYDVFVKENVEYLTETYGYEYNNDVVNSKNIGDRIERGEVLYRSTSFDEHMNYRYGVNVLCMNLIDDRTIEDSVICSRTFANSLVSKKIDTVKVPLNDNDVLINMYGTHNTYKAFPDIGETVKDKIICCKRRIDYAHSLYDFTSANMNRINTNTDTPMVVDGKVIDINIYCNKPISEVAKTPYNAQLLDYLEMADDYYKKVIDVLGTIINSGKGYSEDIGFLYKRALDVTNSDIKWNDNESVFNNMVIEFLVEKDEPLHVGGKICGRFGDKGVIGEILDDDKMHHTTDGRRIDCVFNTFGIPNRLNPGQLYEIEINFAGNRVRERMRDMPFDEKASLAFDFIHCCNPDQARSVIEFYNKLDDDGKYNFIMDIQDGGFYIHQPPFWGNISFDVFKDVIYRKYSWIKKYDIKTHIRDRKVNMLFPQVVGEKYITKLKHTSDSKFTARSIGFLNHRDIPSKSSGKKYNTMVYTSTPIKIGEMEGNILAMSMKMKDIIKMIKLYSSSVIARREMRELFTADILNLEDIHVPANATNRNAEILYVYLKSLGVRLAFEYKGEDGIECYDHGFLDVSENSEDMVTLYIEDLEAAQPFLQHYKEFEEPQQAPMIAENNLEELITLYITDLDDEAHKTSPILTTKHLKYTVDNAVATNFYDIVNSDVIYMDDVLSDMKTWESVFNWYYTMALNNFENVHFRRRQIAIGFRSEIVSNTMSIPNFITALIMMRPFVRLRVNKMDSTLLFDPRNNITKGALKGYIDNKIVKLFRKVAPNQVINMLIAESMEYLNKISHDFGPMMGLSFSLYDIIQLAMNNPEFDELIHTEIPEGLHPMEIEEFVNSNYKRMEKILKENPNGLQPLLLANEGIKSQQLCQLLLCIGNKSDIFGTIYPKPISTNFMIKGLSSVSDYMLDGTSGRKAMIANADQMGKSGYFARKLSLLCFGTMLHKDLQSDCHTPRLLEYTIQGKDDLYRFDARYYKEHPEDLILAQIDGRKDTHLIGKTIYLRSPQTCISKEGICSICYGDLAYTNHDIHIGLYASQNLTEPLSQSILSTKHLDTVNPVKPEWSLGFDEVFTISGNAISLSMDCDLDLNRYSIALGPIRKEDYMDELEFNEYVEYLKIINSKTLEVLYLIEVDDEAKLPMYLSPYMCEMAYRYAKDDRNTNDIVIPLKKLDEYEPWFFINVENQELSRPLKNIIQLLDNKIHMGAVTVEDATRIISAQLVESGLEVQMVHAEVILRNIFRSAEDDLLYPDWSDPDASYQIMTVSEALNKNPSITISLSYERLPEQLKKVDTYRKQEPSLMDAFYVL